jgi:hypothetical protein
MERLVRLAPHLLPSEHRSDSRGQARLREAVSVLGLLHRAADTLPGARGRARQAMAILPGRSAVRSVVPSRRDHGYSRTGHTRSKLPPLRGERCARSSVRDSRNCGRPRLARPSRSIRVTVEAVVGRRCRSRKQTALQHGAVMRDREVA